MCTVSWLHEPGGYHLLCNRDEKRTRGAALGPRIQKSAGVRFVAPADADFGGTWIAVNEFGVSGSWVAPQSIDPNARNTIAGVPAGLIMAWCSLGVCAKTEPGTAATSRTTNAAAAANRLRPCGSLVPAMWRSARGRSFAGGVPI